VSDFAELIPEHPAWAAAAVIRQKADLFIFKEWINKSGTAKGLPSVSLSEDGGFFFIRAASTIFQRSVILHEEHSRLQSCGHQTQMAEALG
jgi:hypothetical protein